jgi:hypothetical protein
MIIVICNKSNKVASNENEKAKNDKFIYDAKLSNNSQSIL